MDIKIAVAYHKASPLLIGDIYIPVHVGKELHKDVELGIQADNTGDNISRDNFTLCELTATYWLWKNVKADYKGLFHYRRILSDKPKLKSKFESLFRRAVRSVHIPTYAVAEAAFLEEAKKLESKLPAMLKDHDIICSEKVYNMMTVGIHFLNVQDYMLLAKRIIEESYPAYIDTFNQTFYGRTFHFGNMVIMRNDLFDEYCTFIFGVFDKMKEILISEGWLLDLYKEKAFSRKLGYVGEALTSVFISKKEAEGVAVKTLSSLTYK